MTSYNESSVRSIMPETKSLFSSHYRVNKIKLVADVEAEEEKTIKSKSNFEKNSINNPNKSKGSSFNSRIRRSTYMNINNLQLENLVKNYESYNKKVRLIDIFSIIIDVTTIYVLYFDHFEYINNNYTLTLNSNIKRFILLGSSFLVITCVILRFIWMKQIYIILTKLGEDNRVQPNRNFLLIEILIHIIQPYPFVNYEFMIKVLGQDVTYSLNLILYFFSTIRIYILIRLVFYWNMYSNNRSQKILNFFSPNANFNLFIYKANLSKYGFITLMILGFLTLIYFSLLLKAFEYTKSDVKNPFYYYWNSLWYLIVTMCTIGYGDIVPYTLLGRFVGVLVCLIGVFILSLLVVMLTLFTDLDCDEKAAYNEIISLSTNFTKKNEIKDYINSIIKYKIRKKLKRVDMQCISDKYHRNLKKVENNIYLKKTLNNGFSYKYFVDKFRDIRETNLEKIFLEFRPMWKIEDKMEQCIKRNEELNTLAYESKCIGFACVNLARCLSSTGNIDQIQSKKLIDHKHIEKAKMELKDDKS